MRFLVDAQLPPALARWLEARGHVAEHVSDLGMMTASDWAIWSFAEEVSAVIVTKDEDFARRRAIAREGPRVLWIRLGNANRRELLAWFSPLLPSVIEALDEGERLIEVN